MLYEKFEKEVKSRFGTITNFLRYADFSRDAYYVAKSRGNIKALSNYKDAFEVLGEPKYSDFYSLIGMPLGRKLRNDIVSSIKNRYGSKNAFCNKNTQFFVTEISYIENGKRKLLSKKTIDIAKSLEINLFKYY